MIIRLIAATVAGGVATFFLGFLIYAMFLGPMFMQPNMHEYPNLLKDPPSMIPLVLANFSFAFLLALVFERWAGIRTFASGATAGAIITFLISLYFGFSMFAFFRMNKNFIPMLADMAGSLVLGALVGGIIALVLGIMNKSAAAE